MGLHHTQHFFEYEVPPGSRVPQPAKMWKSNDGVTLTELKGPAPLRVALSLFYFVPTCAGRGVIPRWAYLPATNLPEHDARTLPLFAKTDYGTAGFAAIQVPPPLPTEMVQQAKDAQAALTRGAAPSR